MRKLGYLFICLILGWIIYTVFDEISQWTLWQSKSVAIEQSKYDSYRIFWLEKDLLFKLPANTEQVRVMLTPVADTIDSSFNLSFSAKDLNGELVDSGVRRYQQKANLERLKGQRFFDTEKPLTADYTSDFYIDGSGDNPLDSLSLSLPQPSKHPIAVRVSVLERKKASELPILWQRLRREKRQELLQGNIYPSDLVSTEHRRTALQLQWQPIGPEGIKGEDYETANLFINKAIQDIEQIAANLTKTNSYQYADSQKVFTLQQQLPALVESIECDKPQQWIEIARETPAEIETNIVNHSKVSIAPEQGLTRIRTSAPCNLTLRDKQEQLVEIPAKAIRGYTLQKSDTLTYQLAAGDEIQPLRIDARGLNLTEADNLQWRIYDNQKQMLLSGEITLGFEQDMYERLPNDDEMSLQQKTQTFITAPENAAYLSLASERASALISVFNRPQSLVFDERQPRWFALWPDNHRELKAAGLSKIVFWQPRLNSNSMQNDLAQWQALTTIPEQPRFALFTPNESELAPSGNFKRWQGETIELTANPGRQQLTPSLIYIRQNATPTPVTIELEQQSYPLWLSAKVGRLSLPPTHSGLKSLTIGHDNPIQWYINHQKDIGEYRIRQVYALAQPLTFLVDKKAEQEWISFHYFPASPDAHAIELTIDAQPQIGKNSGLTILKRRYFIEQQSAAANNYLLNQPSPHLWGPVVFKVQLEDDLSNQTYRLKVSGNHLKGGYIQASFVDDDTQTILKHFSEATYVD